MFSFGIARITSLPLILVTTVTKPAVVYLFKPVYFLVKWLEILTYFHIINGQLKSLSAVCRGKVSVLDTWDQVFWSGHLNHLWNAYLKKLDCTSWRRPPCLLKYIIQKSTKNIQLSCSCSPSQVVYGLIYQRTAVVLPLCITMCVIEVHQILVVVIARIYFH